MISNRVIDNVANKRRTSFLALSFSKNLIRYSVSIVIYCETIYRNNKLLPTIHVCTWDYIPPIFILESYRWHKVSVRNFFQFISLMVIYLVRGEKTKGLQNAMEFIKVSSNTLAYETFRMTVRYILYRMCLDFLSVCSTNIKKQKFI